MEKRRRGEVKSSAPQPDFGSARETKTEPAPTMKEKSKGAVKADPKL
jgi:hypothetical protein